MTNPLAPGRPAPNQLTADPFRSDHPPLDDRA